MEDRKEIKASKEFFDGVICYVKQNEKMLNDIVHNINKRRSDNEKRLKSIVKKDIVGGRVK